MNKQKRRLIRIILGAVAFATGTLCGKLLTNTSGEIASGVLFAIAIIISGWDVLVGAVKGIISLQPFDEKLLMTIACLGAFIIGEYPEAAAVMLFYQVGEYFQSLAVGKSRRSIAALMDIRPDYAVIKTDSGEVKVDPYDVKIDDVLVVKPGERVPLDGVVISGSGTLDTSALTGESVPKFIREGDEILSGCINRDGKILARVTKPYEMSTVSRILDLVENAAANKAKSENFITKFARYYTPCVVAIAVILGVFVPLLVPGQTFKVWLYRALTILVISCPCALVISIPLSFFSGIGKISRIGVLVKGSNCIESLAKTDTVVFDKTGTLTKGQFKVLKIDSKKIDPRELLELAAIVEHDSNHPVSRSICEQCGEISQPKKIENLREIAGHGVTAKVDGKICAVGNKRLMASIGIDCDEKEDNGTAVYVALDGEYLGCITVGDEIKPDCAAAISNLKQQGVKKTVMLTGDKESAAKAVAKKVNIDEVHFELLPEQKVEAIKKIKADAGQSGCLAFVGDGINDAPSLAAADVGVAMGSLGSDAAIEAADVVIMTDEVSKLAKAIQLSRKTLRIVKQNIAFSLSVKIIVLLLGGIGLASMWAAVFADVGVTVIAILNSMRMLMAKQI